MFCCTKRSARTIKLGTRKFFGKSEPKQAPDEASASASTAKLVERGLSYHEESDVSGSRKVEGAELIQKAPTSEIQLRLVRTPMGYGVGLSDFKLASAEKTDFNRVTELASKGTAAEAGVKLFDKIVKVDGEACADAPAVQLMVGKQAILLTLQRPTLEKDQLDELLSAFGKGLQHEGKVESLLTLQAGDENRISADL